jgi:hypothetical protein
MGALNRRKLLQMFAAAGVGTALPFQVRSALSQVATPNRKFVLGVFAGSFPGFDSSLLMPLDSSKYPKGVWHHGNEGESVNPNVNEHFKDGMLVFNRYSKVLSTISNHVCQGVAFPRSLNHDAARSLQLRGEVTNSGFISGAADILNRGNLNPALVRGIANISTNINSAVQNVVQVNGSSPSSFAKAFVDSNNLAKNSFTRAGFDLQHQFLKTTEIPSAVSQQTADALKAYETQLYQGAPESLNPTSASYLSVESFFDIAKVLKLIDEHIGSGNDGEEVKAQFNTDRIKWMAIWDQFKAAALLAVTGVGKGYDIFINDRGHDLHQPQNSNFDSSSVESARSSGIMWAMITVFWQYMISAGMTDDTLVFVTSEFSRTSYNSHRFPNSRTVTFNGAPIQVSANGTDHAPAVGYVFIGGKVPPKQRFGNVADNYSVFGSLTGSGVISTDIPAYTSSKLVLSIFMRSFDRLFPSTQEMRRYWKDFDEPIPAVLI